MNAVANSVLGSKPVRKPVPPAEGRARWLRDDPDGRRWLQIDTLDDRGVTLIRIYRVTRVECGWLLERKDKATGKVRSYTIDRTVNGGLNGVMVCTCPDAEHRGERRDCCKHIRGLKAALAARPF